MFGGIVGIIPGATVYADTWVWEGSQWLQMHPSSSPPGRSGSSLGYDPISRRMILYGGGTNFYAQGVDPSKNDTWAWDGQTWTQLFPAHSPTQAVCCDPGETVYDPSKPGLWLTFGLLSTWAWSGSDWVETLPGARPPERIEFGLAYDDQLRGVVAACGYAGEGVSGPGEAAPYHDDTWLWKDGAWTELHPPTKPARGPCTAAYDAARGELVLFSDIGGTFTFDGANWALQRPSHSPPIVGSSDASMAYDSSTQEVVLFGGRDQYADLNQTWTWDGNDWSKRT